MDTSEPASSWVTEQYEMQGALLEAEGSVGQDLAAMDAAVSAGAVKIGSAGLNGTETEAELARMGRFPWAVDTITVNETGIIDTVEPESYKAVTGEDLSSQKHLQRLYSEKLPVISDVFLSVEGVTAVDIASPVFSRDGRFIGATTLLFRPDILFEQNTPKKADGTPWHIWVMQPDGLIVYDPDPGQAGKNIFSDPLFQPYPGLIRVSGNISRERQGAGTYIFMDNGVNVTKEALWTTVGIRGSEWRLVIARVNDTSS
jgi:hypothetical protein